MEPLRHTAVVAAISPHCNDWPYFHWMCFTCRFCTAAELQVIRQQISFSLHYCSQHARNWMKDELIMRRTTGCRSSKINIPLSTPQHLRPQHVGEWKASTVDLWIISSSRVRGWGICKGGGAFRQFPVWSTFTVHVLTSVSGPRMSQREPIRVPSCQCCRHIYCYLLFLL